MGGKNTLLALFGVIEKKDANIIIRRKRRYKKITIEGVITLSCL